MTKKNQLRIIGGQWRGRKLSVADAPGLRPTGDRIRETLFNWLAADIPGSHCLDLFAGSGALGFESASRGAASVVMIEKHPAAAKQLKAHQTLLQASTITIHPQDAITWMQHSKNSGRFDIVFIDPPFAENLWDETLNALVNHNLLNNDALIYIETPKNHTLMLNDNWEIIKEKTTGDVCYRLLQFLS